jgi:hypothetical protein
MWWREWKERIWERLRCCAFSGEERLDVAVCSKLYLEELKTAVVLNDKAKKTNEVFGYETNSIHG